MDDIADLQLPLVAAAATVADLVLKPELRVLVRRAGIPRTRERRAAIVVEQKETQLSCLKECQYLGPVLV